MQVIKSLCYFVISFKRLGINLNLILKVGSTLVSNVNKFTRLTVKVNVYEMPNYNYNRLLWMINF